MKSALALLSLLFAFLLVQSYARTEQNGASTRTGKVEALYEEVHPGVYVPHRLTSRESTSLWAHVRFDRPLEDGRNFVVAALPQGMAVKINDMVEMQLGDMARFDERGPDRNVVTAVFTSSLDELRH
ncbi:MAG TPA: hypothetical protein VFB54_05400 [Burkholderiales bacterium]|nr:hypothetical protein [Burkholderiales bacterium]